ncbi:MAG: extracellular solute-binding protein, partial [Phycisphaeraceae bacterium]|nr:extracellular solute-binding protein [Phycisphaeraceae bacterium]
HEAFKVAMRNFLVSDAPDLITWNAGNRMKVFVDLGLLEDVSDVWEAEGLYEKMPAVVGASSVDGKQYGVPYTYYQWGVYYRKDIFDRFGLSTPQSWDDFLTVCETLKENGITPIAIGTEPLWPAAGWFDYLNLRLNGLDFHLDLTAGKVPYTDERIRKVFEQWRPLLDNGYFIDNHADLAWQDAVPFLADGRAAMYLIGNFVVPLLKEAGIIDKIDFFPFPTIDPAVPLYEDAPIDTVHIPAGAKNKEDARKFLAFISRPDVQASMNLILRQLPANRNAEIPNDPFLQAGQELLNEAEGVAQFYDRDATPEMARTGMLGFQKFMQEPERLDSILERLEIERRRIYEIRQPPSQQ